MFNNQNNLLAEQKITLEVNGQPFTGFIDPISVSTSIENMCGTFSFTATDPKKATYPVQIGDKCRALIGNVAIVNGYVEDIGVNYDKSGHIITIDGRDKTCDIVDGTLDGKQTFQASNLIDITKKILNYFGINDIEVSSNVSINPFTPSEMLSADVGQTAFGLLEAYAKKRQILITTDGNGNIVYTRSGDVLLKTMIVNSNTINSKPIIKSASMNVATDKRFYKYVGYANTNAGGMGMVEDFSQLPVEQEVSMISVPAYDVTVRNRRIYNFMADLSNFSQSDLNDRVTWEANVRRANGFKYTVTVQGFIAEQDNLVWRPNQLVNVIDDICGINAQLLISSIRYNYSLANGSETIIDLVDKDSYTIKIIDKNTQKKKEKTSKQGKSFIYETLG